jgi:hypothetical protein
MKKIHNWRTVNRDVLGTDDLNLRDLLAEVQSCAEAIERHNQQHGITTRFVDDLARAIDRKEYGWAGGIIESILREGANLP